MRMIVIIGAVGLFAASFPALAADSSNNAARSDAARDQPQANGAARDRQICVVEARSETRVRRPVCHTAREWRDLEGEVPSEHQ